MKIPSFLVAFVLLLAATPSLAQSFTSRETIDFENDVVPVLTKHGCNAGACHGAAIGRGGLKLSLYGSGPKEDYIAIARHLRGRRVNLSTPEESLVLLKPTEQLEHGGGRRFDWDSESANRLVRWIEQGARFRTQINMVKLEVLPKLHVSQVVGEAVPLQAVAHYSDGTTRDVTRWTIFESEDPAALKIEASKIESGSLSTATVVRPGRHVVLARYLSQVMPLEFLTPLTDQENSNPTNGNDHFIDREIQQTLRTLRLPISTGISDDAFRRRVTLDLTGRLPTPPKGTLAVDRRELVDQLLSSDEFAQYWTFWFAKLLRIKPVVNDAKGAATYHRWLSDQIVGHASYKKIVTELVTAKGDSHEHGPANFYRTVGGPREQAEFFSELFMGSRLRCANCHNHPLDRWTQDDYHGLAAIFAKVESGRVVREKPGGEVIHPRTGLPATQRIPGDDPIEGDTRDALASWMTDEQNPYFAKSIVNRLWKQMMGRGLVEPVDDFRSTNPATHPQLLDQLAEDFVKHGYDIRHTLRQIANSRSYARSVDANKLNRDDDRFYSHALRRPLEPEVLADAISDVLGVPGQYGERPIGTRAIQLVDPKVESRTLDVLGRCDRQDSCESSAPNGSLSQKLHLFNGPLLNSRISANGSRLNRLIAKEKTPMEIIGRYYVLALGRSPTSEEESHWNSIVASLTTKNQVNEFLTDFVWGLMTCEEFTTNH